MESQHPYILMPVKFADEPAPVPRWVYSPYGERPGARIVVAIASEVDRWITCVVERVVSTAVHVKIGIA
jgi:hypothetical protein